MYGTLCSVGILNGGARGNEKHFEEKNNQGTALYVQSMVSFFFAMIHMNADDLLSPPLINTISIICRSLSTAISRLSNRSVWSIIARRIEDVGTLKH